MLAAVHLTRRFGARVAVEDVSLEIREGEIVALVGPNGAGKTTTLRMLAGLIEPDQGQLLLRDRPVTRGNAARLRAAVGLLTEHPGVWDSLTVRQNLLTYARLHGLAEPGVRVDRVLETFVLTDRAGDRASTLSKGLRQRVALARTLLHDPPIVLLDEPTSGLDPRSAKEVRDGLLRLRDDRRAILLSTHNLADVDRLATRVTILRTRVIAADTPAALRARLAGPRVTIRVAGPARAHLETIRSTGAACRLSGEHGLTIDLSPSSPVTGALVRALVAGGADILAVLPDEPSLEDVYLRLTGDDGGAA